MDRVEFALQNLKGKILDVGYSVGGIHSKFIEKFGKENVYGVDIETEKDTEHYRRATAEKIPFPDSCFDSVFAGELIEHVARPAEFIVEANRVLKKGGILMLTTPNRASLVNRLFHNYETKIHISLFDYPNLEELLESSGFHVEKYYCQPYSEENAYGSRNKWTFVFRALLHKVLPKGLQEQMIVKAVKVQLAEGLANFPSRRAGRTQNAKQGLPTLQSEALRGLPNHEVWKEAATPFRGVSRT